MLGSMVYVMGPFTSSREGAFLLYRLVLLKYHCWTNDLAQVPLLDKRYSILGLTSSRLAGLKLLESWVQNPPMGGTNEGAFSPR